jgi:hypothetical protein
VRPFKFPAELLFKPEEFFNIKLSITVEFWLELPAGICVAAKPRFPERLGFLPLLLEL